MTAYMDPQGSVGGRRETRQARAAWAAWGGRGAGREPGVYEQADQRQTPRSGDSGPQPQSFAMRILRDERASCQHAPGPPRPLPGRPVPIAGSKQGRIHSRPIGHADVVDQRPEIAAGSGRRQTPHRRCRARATPRTAAPEVARCVIEQRLPGPRYDTDAVVAGNHLPRQRRLPDPDVMDVYEPMAGGDCRREASRGRRPRSVARRGTGRPVRCRPSCRSGSARRGQASRARERSVAARRDRGRRATPTLLALRQIGLRPAARVRQAPALDGHRGIRVGRARHVC